ncbi:MAG: hypothetical protein QMC03_06735 [Flavobacteriales bacterium]
MKTEEQYHIDWLASKDGLLTSSDLEALMIFIKEHATIYEQWLEQEFIVSGLKSTEWGFSENFNLKVLKSVRENQVPIFDKSSLFVVTIGVAASLVLMLNLFVEQNTWGFEALLGIADMDSNNTNLLFYINS